jgi:nitrogen fixation/metabolism regulation signal transduction histidine kinase
MNTMIVVSDNGPGIDPSDLPFLGEAFYTRKPKGTGLGLFITRRAMEANDGKLDFGFYPNDPDYLTGANTVLVFEQEKGRLGT